MSRRSQKKVPTDGGNDRLATLEFSALDALAGQLPPAKSPPAKNVSEAKAKANKAKDKAKPAGKGRVEVRREKAGRGGKTVTTLQSFPSHIPLKTLEAMVFELKKECACGGTLKGRVIELQGDVCDKVCELLKGRGYQAVRAGG